MTRAARQNWRTAPVSLSGTSAKGHAVQAHQAALSGAAFLDLVSE